MGYRPTLTPFQPEKRAMQRGFTLIEVLVVVAILAAALGMVAVRLSIDDRNVVRDEADRLVLLLQAARETAILEGTVLAFEMRPKGYRFLRPSKDDKGKSKLIPVTDEPLAPREFPPKMDVRFDIDGQQAQPKEARQGMVLDPSGALPTFRVSFLLNDARWWILGQPDGKIVSSPVADAKK